ncbi:heat shock factor protein 1-like [Conger conger]|uniref:heat shock factor protein 1-like n=1 Tax=Conger conger TaxID=82655 RepID=UPI002A598A5A|nr:heat shock factor protein 1-like [Conger conger]XP_061112893.1 heat shock factor protein 1-like [Conger conger]XP_061112900.1 heat shock factor protein 1-like [Conger conger]
MEGHGGGSSSVISHSYTNVPAFLVKLWTLVEDPDTDPLICWSQSGTTFHVFDQAKFSKEVLPKYFKHNNMASFVRQLNMYGFRKVVHIEQGGLLKPDIDDTEFQHPDFIRGQAHLLENIKRKVTNVSGVKQEDVRLGQDDITNLLSDAKSMKGKQEAIDSKISAMKYENEALWREIASLRQKHAQQQKVVTKVIQFLFSLAQSKGVRGLKRKMPLMLGDSSSAHSLPKYSRQLSLEPLPGSSAVSAAFSPLTGENLVTPEVPVTSGPIISDITDRAQKSPTEATSRWTEEIIPLVHLMDEPAPVREEGPESLVEEVGPVGVDIAADTPLSPTTFINSLLEESKPIPASQCQPLPAIPTQPDESQNCLHMACLDKNGLNEHVESIDSGLDNLQTILNNQAMNFDSSSFLEMFSPSNSEFSLPDLDTSLSSFEDLLTHDQKAETGENSVDCGKPLIQYTAQPILENPTIPDCSRGEPILLLEEEAFYGNSENTDPTTSLQSNNH